jgi:cellulose synthase/poly-beta-1,6-N-acetylglucosamine synthase-like glycosyltransferase
MVSLFNLTNALQAASPRLTRRPTPLASLLITLFIYGSWAVLLSRAFLTPNVFAWSIGIVYIAYDTLQLIFVAARTLIMGAPATPSTAARVSATVVVAAYNEARVLIKTIDALMAQEPKPEQIILADDGSDDGTAALLSGHYGLERPALGALSSAGTVAPPLRWLLLPRGGKANALNAALLVSSGDIVLTVDADTLLAPGALSAMRDAFAADPHLRAAGGLLAPICDRSLSGRLFQYFQTYEYRRNFIARFAWARSDCLLLISGAFAAYRRDAILAIGGFDAASLVEDYELTHRLYRFAGERGEPCHVRIIAAAQARTDAPARLMSFLHQRRRWFAGFLQTQYWNRDMTGNGRFGAVGRLMLPVKLVDSFQPIYGLSAFFLLLYFLIDGEAKLAGAALLIMTGKIALDLAFHLWSLALYRRCSGDPHRINWWQAALAVLVEPFSFQLLRHSAATWGWLVFLTGSQSWANQQRHGLLTINSPAEPPQPAA